MNNELGTILQSDDSATGFFKVIGVDPSLPHPSGGTSHFNFIVCEYDPRKPAAYGSTIKLTKDEAVSLYARNNLVFEEPINE